jgi:uncharacterized protein YlaI
LASMGKTLATRDDASDLLRHGSSDALRTIARQLLRDHSDRFDTTDYLEKVRPFRVHLCPKCNSKLRTPQARQCLECGYDWHSGPNHDLPWDGMDYEEQHVG